MIVHWFQSRYQYWFHDHDHHDGTHNDHDDSSWLNLGCQVETQWKAYDLIILNDQLLQDKNGMENCYLVHLERLLFQRHQDQ
jgi:hypothetical protein